MPQFKPSYQRPAPLMLAARVVGLLLGLVGCTPGGVEEVNGGPALAEESELTVPPAGSGFTFEGSYHLINKSGPCVATEGTRLVSAPCSMDASQKLTLYRMEDGRYEICLPGTLDLRRTGTARLATDTYSAQCVQQDPAAPTQLHLANRTALAWRSITNGVTSAYKSNPGHVAAPQIIDAETTLEWMGANKNITVLNNGNIRLIDPLGGLYQRWTLRGWWRGLETATVDAGAADGGSPSDGGVTIDKWHPGIYTKLEDWQLQSPYQMAAVYEELRTTPQLRGIRVTILWGRYEKRDAVTGAISYDFSQIDQILSTLATLNNKHLILSFAWREFKGTLGASNILPNDLRGGSLWKADPNWEHIDYDYLWAYKMSRQAGTYGYNLKLWDATVLSRLDGFLAALGAHADKHPNLTVVSTTESAIGEPVIPFGSGESDALQFEGQLAVIRKLRKYFPNCLTIPDLNFSREHVADVVSIMETEGIGLGSSNSNRAEGLNYTGKDPGVLTYYPLLSGKVALAPEIQGDDYLNSNSDDTVPDYPSYESIYLRVRNDLKANYTVMQRNTPFWLGDSTTPSMLNFIRTYPLIKNDSSGTGGLNPTRPTNL